MTDIPNDRMIHYPAGSLVITERFRILGEEDDLADVGHYALAQEGMGVARLALVSVLDNDPEVAIVRLVRAAALLTVAADRLIQTRMAEGAGT
jgi:hypothetical protein